MELLEKRFYYIELLRLYGELLSSTQQEIIQDHLECDLSLSEIADNRGISRAAVDDAIKKGMKKLDAFEQALKLYAKNEKILENTQVLKEKFGNCDEIEKIEEVLKNGI